jgi:hypothetical protein
VRDALPSLGADVAMVSLDVDTSENASQLAKFADAHRFAWRFAIAPKDMLVQFQRAFGTEFLTPPSEPMFIIDPKGDPHLIDFGHRDANRMRELVARYRTA